MAGSQIDCFLDGQYCFEPSIEIFNEIPTLEECAQLCGNHGTCTAFTLYGPYEPYVCELFSSCQERKPCEDCITGSTQENCVCSIAASGRMDSNNLVGSIGMVPDEYACKQLCASNERCSVYTYMGPGAVPISSHCILLNSEGLQNPVISCDNCASGPAKCNSNLECQVAVFVTGRGDGNYDFTTDLKLLVTEETGKHVDLRFVAGEKDCYMNVSFLAIGGGGGGGWGRGGGGGGGSGHIEIGSTSLFSKDWVVVSVGYGQSSVRVNGDPLVQGVQGGDGGLGGGDGYSGGGGPSDIDDDGHPPPGGRGGTNGGDGEHGDGETDFNRGGHGSGLDLSTLPMKNFVLTPGQGGYSEGTIAGGGGGGVVVNGMTPGNTNKAGWGEGFGGGAGGGSDIVDNGNPGCVLIET